MKRILTVILISLLYIPLQAQLIPEKITFNTLKEGVIDDDTFRNELILNGFTKVTDSSGSSTETYAYGYDEEKGIANIKVSIYAIKEYKNAGLYEISVLTSGDYIHDDLVEEITENCAFDRIGVGDELGYTCDYTTFLVSSQGGNNLIIASPNFEQLPKDSQIMDVWKELLKESMTERDMEEYLKSKEMEEE